MGRSTNLITDSWAGMTYLALFLASKFSVSIPYLLPYQYDSHSTTPNAYSDEPSVRDSSQSMSKDFSSKTVSSSSIPLRKQAAAPPIYLLVLPIIPICAAIYISSTRFSDFRHHGFDILFGSLMGFFLAFMCFRLYHLPIRRGGGWSWGPRSPPRAFGIGVGIAGYVINESAQSNRGDLELGQNPIMALAEPETANGISSSQTNRISKEMER